MSQHPLHTPEAWADPGRGREAARATTGCCRMRFGVAGCGSAMQHVPVVARGLLVWHAHDARLLGVAGNLLRTGPTAKKPHSRMAGVRSVVLSGLTSRCVTLSHAHINTHIYIQRSRRLGASCCFQATLQLLSSRCPAADQVLTSCYTAAAAFPAPAQLLPVRLGSTWDASAQWLGSSWAAPRIQLSNS